MRYLVYSDIHGNIDALEKVIEEIGELRPNFVVSLGDVVGYGASPAECVQLVERSADIKICGNHDYVAAGLSDSESFNVTARISIEWTRDVLTSELKEMIGRYETLKRHGQCVFAHSSTIAPLDWEYIYTVRQAERLFRETPEKFIFIGHTHIPGVISFDEQSGCRIEHSTMIHAEPGRRYLINTGSIGQPRDGLSAASFALVDARRGTINMRRIPYDVFGAQEKIRMQGLPESLASRLALAK
jgi:predicted phosphodiesterase